MKKSTIVCKYLLFIMVPLFAQNTLPPSGAIKAANEEFISFLTQAFTEDTKTIAGFDAADELHKAVLGRPFKLYDLSADAIKKFAGDPPLESVLSETNMWYFPIKIGNATKMFLYVGKKDGIWRRAGLGSAPLATQFQNVTKQWPFENGYTPLLIKQKDIGGYLYNIPQAKVPNLTEIKTAFTRPGTAKKSAALRPLQETMQDLKKRIVR